MLTTEAVGLAIKISKGLIKLGVRVDMILAEKEAVEGPLALPVPKLTLLPTQPQMRRALRKLLEDTQNNIPDPLGFDRNAIQNTIDQNPDNTKLFDFMQIYIPEQAIGREIDLNEKFFKELRKSKPEWANDPELLITAFYIGAGRDYRNKSYSWRIALTVVDVVSEFGAENVALFTRDKRIQSIAGSVLNRFAEADIQTIDSNEGLIKTILSATLNGALDSREILDIDNKWIDSLLDALVNARESVPENERDNFIVGLIQGKGYPILVSSILENTAAVLNDDNSEDFKDVASDFLKEVASIIKDKPSFEDFFDDHWGDILRAGLTSVERHGPALLKGESPFLSKILLSIVTDLAKRPNNKFLSTDALLGIIDASISAVAANPDLVDDTVDEEWLATLVSSISSTVSNTGIRDTFTQEGIETLVKETLSTFSEHPELIIKNPGLARDLLRGVLVQLSDVETLAVEQLASAAIGGALNALSEQPELLTKLKYPQFLSTFTLKIATLVIEKQVTNIQGADILNVVTESIAENPLLFLESEKRMVNWVVEAVVKVSNNNEMGLLAGATLIGVMQEVVIALATTGKAALTNHPANVFAEQLEQLISAGLTRAQSELGNRINISSIPTVIGSLVESWSIGEIATIDPDNDNFKRLFSNIVERIAA